MESKADGIDCFFDTDYVTDDFVKMFTDAGLEFHVWTVDDLDLALEAFRRGAKTVTTNCAKQLLDEYEKWNDDSRRGRVSRFQPQSRRA
jgi:glycerophosphoryl diester phosphodiesterase